MITDIFNEIHIRYLRPRLHRTLTIAMAASASPLETFMHTSTQSIAMLSAYLPALTSCHYRIMVTPRSRQTGFPPLYLPHLISDPTSISVLPPKDENLLVTSLCPRFPSKPFSVPQKHLPSLSGNDTIHHPIFALGLDSNSSPTSTP